MIPVDNSPKNSQKDFGGSKEVERIKEYLALKQIPFEELSKEQLERIKELEKEDKKLKKVYKRLERLPVCGRTGHLGYKPLDGLEFELRYIPHRCGSNICPICSFYESQRKYKKVFDLLKLSVDLKEKKLAFITLTSPPKGNPYEAVEAILEYRKRLYNLNLSHRVLRGARKYLFKELISFYHNLKRKKGNIEARRRIKLEIERIRKFLKELENKIERFREENPKAKKVRISDVFPSIVKVEVHKTPKGWYAHIHIISEGYVPKVLLTSLWRYITNDESYICDIRKVEGERAIREISKYETKPVNDKITDFSKLWSEGKVYQKWNGMNVEISLEELFELEYALFGRKKLVVWGKWAKVEELEEEKEEKEEIIPLWCVDVRLDRPIFRLPKLVREVRRTGKEALLSECEIVFSRVEEGQVSFKGEVRIDRDGKLRVIPEFQSEEEKLWFEELLDRSLMYVLEKKRKRFERVGRKTIEEGELPKFLRERMDVNFSLEFF